MAVAIILFLKEHWSTTYSVIYPVYDNAKYYM